jgi:hypothetical protein
MEATGWKQNVHNVHVNRFQGAQMGHVCVWSVHITHAHNQTTLDLALCKTREAGVVGCLV